MRRSLRRQPASDPRRAPALGGAFVRDVVARAHPCLESCGVGRARKVEALPELAAEATQTLQLPGLLNPLGHDLQAKRAAERDDRVRKRPLVGVVIDEL